MSNVPFAAQMEELAAYMASKISVPTIGIGGGYAPIGTINFFDATTAPQDWLACDGSVHNIADYPQLAEWYATQHGAANFYGGNGTTTFAVPNLQGEFLRGTGTNSHTNQGNGAGVGEHRDATQIPRFQDQSGKFLVSTEKGFALVDAVVSNDGLSLDQFTKSGTIQPATKHEMYTTRPTNTSFLICVKAVVAGEVYSTEERVVGTWIDGKPLYQRTLQMTMPTLSTKYAITPIADCEIIFVISAFEYSSNSVLNANPAYGNDAKLHGSVWTTSSLHPDGGRVILQADDNVWAGVPVYITVQYTKTTDA